MHIYFREKFGFLIYNLPNLLYHVGHSTVLPIVLEVSKPFMMNLAKWKFRMFEEDVIYVKAGLSLNITEKSNSIVCGITFYFWGIQKDILDSSSIP